ncbi:SpoIIE family protein phosphatase [Solirubrobacter phytolaccae]|uniref:SpoIIE family protein phosphatase n=1 Tax=Solirubrobacter phytolaccae TaxID=1404360 RepID=A0A9X3NLX0_9ACTN|nr:SpoIIE family protein phosphatase [Solirubrobacter phytolaccae]MDA0183927.1 SpoIIE family protein phosphatase [Solirubrobacter phytolaccae]
MEADPARIEAARRLLAEVPGEAIDRLAALSARLLGATHAQVSLFTDVQVPLTPPTPRRPPADVLAAATFADAPAPAQPGIGAYLGATIDADGHRVGVLCVYDAQEFAWTEHDQDLLKELAAAVAAELERGSLAAELEDSTARLDLGFAAADIGSFDWDLQTDALHFDDRLLELFGYTLETWTPHIDSFSVRLHADDLPRTQAAIAKAIEHCGDYEADYRVVHADGSTRWVAARGRVLCDERGKPARMLGAAYDTTAVHSAAERLGRVLETMSTAFMTLDLNWRFRYVNGAAERMLGHGRYDLVGQDLWAKLPELRNSEAERKYRRALESGEEVGFEHYHPTLDAWFDVRAIPSEDGLSVYFHDITGRVRAEQDAARLAGEREDALAASGAATGRLQILSGASARLAGTLEAEEILTILSDVLLNGFGSGVVIALKDRLIRDLEGQETTTAGPGFRIAHTANTDEVLRGRFLPAGALAAAAVQEQPASTFDVSLGGRLALTLPLVSRGRMLGAILVLDPASSALDRRVMIELAARAGVALDNAMLFGAERRMALTLQRSLLPADLPERPGIALAARYLPGTGGRDVGGDFYIAHPLEDDRLLLVIGDVMGHGAQAAARMGQLRAVLAAYAYDGDPPDRVLAHLSVRAPALLDLPMATVLAAVYDPTDRRLTFSLAGHLPPLIVAPDHDAYFVAADPGPPLGTQVGEYERHVTTLPPDATLVFYTDGLIEERDRAIDAGMEELRRALTGVDLSPDDVADHLLTALDREQGGEDDIALLVMRA